MQQSYVTSCNCDCVGQGLNMTMEDAAELAWHVQQHGLTAEALRSFELERIPRVGVIVKKAQVWHLTC
jgi:2-polyprenyl-6-methoxyphenol hydroxylase-like FAD-dependent oxidoreductase